MNNHILKTTPIFDNRGTLVGNQVGNALLDTSGSRIGTIGLGPTFDVYKSVNDFKPVFDNIGHRIGSINNNMILKKY